MGLILHDVDLSGARAVVRIEDGRVAAVGDVGRRHDDEVVNAAGGALLPGLHDHHIHVLALAAARSSVDIGPLTTPSRAAFESALRAAAPRGAVRAVGYHERVAGALDRDVLDAIVGNVPVRVQHRTGGLWILNSRALDTVDAARLDDPRFERDDTGRLSGRVWRGNDLVVGETEVSSDALTALGRDLLRLGVTTVTDATASNDTGSAALLGQLPQRVRVMGPAALTFDETERLEVGEVKVLLDDDALPDIDELTDLVRRAHARSRGVAVHCVTLVQLRFALELFRNSGVREDRIEHASVAPADAIDDLRALGLRVATQPAFVSARGDDYLLDVDPRDAAALYPLASLLAAGVPTYGSSDAPFGPLDPWEAMSAAVHRRTARGAVVVPRERIDPSAALTLFTGAPAIAPGQRADLILLSVPLREALRRLRCDDVVLTIVAGEILYDAR